MEILGCFTVEMTKLLVFSGDGDAVSFQGCHVIEEKESAQIP
jgi:hypothetical protein